MLELSQNREVVVDDVRDVEQDAGSDVHEDQYLYQHGAAPVAAVRLTGCSLKPYCKVNAEQIPITQ